MATHKANYNLATQYLARIGGAWSEGVFELSGLPTNIVDKALADLRLASNNPVSLQYVDTLKAAIEQERKSQIEEDRLYNGEYE